MPPQLLLLLQLLLLQNCEVAVEHLLFRSHNASVSSLLRSVRHLVADSPAMCDSSIATMHSASLQKKVAAAKSGTGCCNGCRGLTERTNSRGGGADSSGSFSSSDRQDPGPKQPHTLDRRRRPCKSAAAAAAAAAAWGQGVRLIALFAAQTIRPCHPCIANGTL